MGEWEGILPKAVDKEREPECKCSKVVGNETKTLDKRNEVSKSKQKFTKNRNSPSEIRKITWFSID
ncbi:hypothetical protein ABE288_08605 [Bacillus salipaludis]|uniref:hypothetical protein n=1 Tax=Bacillus salipaludis TaxID=2547811 RepID=UPI003D1CB504